MVSTTLAFASILDRADGLRRFLHNHRRRRERRAALATLLSMSPALREKHGIDSLELTRSLTASPERPAAVDARIDVHSSFLIGRLSSRRP
jgi:hypothetical protein